MTKKILGKAIQGTAKVARAGLKRAAQQAAVKKKRRDMKQFKEAEA